MTHLYQEVSKKGTEFLNTIFNKEITITEKLDGTALICKRTKSGIIFFGRDGTKKIDKVARMFSTMYEAGIEYLKTKDLSFLRLNEELHFEYFAPKVTHIVSYDNIPENGLVLLASTTKRNLNMIAYDLGVLPPPIIFKGKLNDEQKDELTKFLIMSPELRQIKFKTNSFTSFIVSLLNDNYTPALGSNDIEGIVISTQDGTFVSKIIDPLFTDTVMSKKDNDEVKAEYYKDISRLVTNLEMTGVETYDSPEANIEDRYIDFLMNIIINNISSIMDKKQEFAKYDFGKPYIASYTDFNYNVFPKVVSDIMKDNPWFRDFARLTFNTYVKPKNRATKNFSKDDIQIINRKIELIKKYVLLDDDLDDVVESVIDEPLEVYGVMFGRFQPLTNGHLKGIVQMSEQADKGCIYLVKGEKTSSDKDKNPFDEEIQIKMLEAVVPKNIEVKVINAAFFPDVINEMDYNNYLVFCGSDRYTSYSKMLSYVDEGKTVEIIEINRDESEDVSATKVRAALKNEDKELFEQMTPKEIHNFYEELLTYIGE
jgi:cytidyltransferase-like protein